MDGRIVAVMKLAIVFWVCEAVFYLASAFGFKSQKVLGYVLFLNFVFRQLFSSAAWRVVMLQRPPRFGA
jgi:hypothetical protein